VIEIKEQGGAEQSADKEAFIRKMLTENLAIRSCFKIISKDYPVV
jgi:hypothetical protein